MKNVVIVGSGIGGLSAGANLSKEGYCVTVIEKHIIPGGYATNFIRKAKTGEKFVFDVSLHGIGNLTKGRGFYNILENLGILNKIKPIRKSETATVVFNNGETFDIPDDFDTYKKVLIDKFPNEVEGIENLFQFLRKFDNDMEKNVYDSGEIPRYIQLLQNITLYDFLKKYINDEKFINLFCFLWLYYGLPAKEVNAYYYLVAWISYHIGGTYYMEGGSGAFSKAFADIIEENGGHIVLREEVVKINTENNKIISVTTNKGRTFKGDVFVINGCVENIFNCVDKSETVYEYLKQLQNKEISCSLTQLYIGIDTNPSNLGLEKADYFFDYEESSQIGYKYIKEANYEKIHFGIVNYNILDPNLNKDTGYICITIGDLEKNWPERDTKEYKIKKQQVIDILLKRLYYHFPKLENHIVILELATPKTMMRYTNNKLGAVYGFAQNTKEGGFDRLPIKTPFENCYLASAWTQPGGGYEGAILSGVLSSDVILGKYKDTEKEIVKDDILQPNMFMVGMLEEINKKYIKNIKAKYLFDFKDIDKKYAIKIENDKVFLDTNSENSDVNVTCDYKIWYKIATNELSGQVAFREGSLNVKGDIDKFNIFTKALEVDEQKEVKPKKKLVRGDVLFPITLAPFIFYWATSNIPSLHISYDIYAMISVFYTLLVVPLLKPKYLREQITTLEKVNIITFSLMFIMNYTTGHSFIGELILPIALFLSCFKGENMLAQYTKLGFNDNVTKTKLFNKINKNLTIMWSVIFVLQFVIVKLIFGHILPGEYPLSNLAYLLSALGTIISFVYPKKAMGS